MGLFNWRKKRDDPTLSSMAWDDRPSIFERIRRHCRPGTPGLIEGGMTLSDEEHFKKGSEIGWASGAMDGVLTHHMGSFDNSEVVERTVQLIVDYCKQPTAFNKAKLYESLLGEHVIAQLDELLARLLEHGGCNELRLYDLARSLVLEAPDREPVKLGIALLGLFRRPDDLETFLTIGRHDEFTLYATVAILNQKDDAEKSLWELAKNVFGWGRIHVVERLSGTTDPAIRDWMIRDGFRNQVMYEYLAGLCARSGGLLDALQDDECDSELLKSASELLQAWIMGGPAEELGSYDESVALVEAFLAHMHVDSMTLDAFLTVAAIRTFVECDARSTDESVQLGWTADQRGAVIQKCERLIAAPEWPSRVEKALLSDDRNVFLQGDHCARILKIETWDHHWRRLKEDPLDDGPWFYLMRDANVVRVRQLASFAEEVLPLEQIACGPADEMGFGPDFKAESCLGFIVQDLGKHPGCGISLLRAALKCRVVRMRWHTLMALEAWGRDHWWPSATEELAAAAAVEPREDLRDGIRRLLAGQPVQQAE